MPLINLSANMSSVIPIFVLFVQLLKNFSRVASLGDHKCTWIQQNNSLYFIKYFTKC